MAQLYREQGVTDVANQVTTSEGNLTKTTINPIRQTLNNISDYENQQAQKFERKANESLELYERGMQNLTSQSMKELYEANKTNPQALQKEFEKLSSDIIDTIPDENTRINVKAKYLLDSQTYLNGAKNNLETLQKKQMKQKREESLFANLDLYSSSFENLLHSGGSEDDYANYSIAKNEIERTISAKDENGLYYFSPAQQRQMKENLKKAQVEVTKNYFNNLPENEKSVFIDDFTNDYMTFISGSRMEGNKKIFKGEDLASIMDKNERAEVKEYLNRYKKKFKENEELAPEIASQIAIENAMAEDDIKNISKTIVNTKGSLNKGVEIDNVLAWRRKIQDYYNSGVFDDKDYQKNIAKTIKPMMDLTKEFSTDWLNKPLYQKVYKNVLSSSDGKELSNLSDNEKAYILSESYNRLVDANIDPKSTSWGTSDRLKEIAKSIQNDYLINKDNSLLTKQIDRVILGTDVYDFTEGKAVASGSKNYKIMQSPDGGIYKVFFINGEAVQRTRIK